MAVNININLDLTGLFREFANIHWVQKALIGGFLFFIGVLALRESDRTEIKAFTQLAICFLILALTQLIPKATRQFIEDFRLIRAPLWRYAFVHTYPHIHK